MADLADLNLAALLPAQLKKLDSVVERRLKEAAVSDRNLAVPKAVRRVVVAPVEAAVRRELGTIQVLPLIIQTLAKAHEIREIARAQIKDDGGDQPVALFAPHLSIDNPLTITMRFFALPVIELTFQLSLSAQFNDVSLVLRRAEIIAIGRTTANIGLRLQCEGTDITPKFESQPYELLHDHPLATPIRVVY